MRTPKWLKWEFLPWQYFYIPIYTYYILLGVRERSLGWMSAVNPDLPLGGMADTSKQLLLDHILEDFKPKGLLIKRNFSTEEVLLDVNKAQIQFPLIAKPDRMERGRGVQLLANASELDQYHQRNSYNYLIQEYINYPLELGIMYHRMPNQEKGRITSIVKKGFLSVKGDGVSTLRQLIVKHPRAHYYKKRLLGIWSKSLETVIEEGTDFLLEPIGNHNRGTTFYNANSMINNELSKVFDKIAKYVPNFYFGRFDVRVPSEDDLYEGRNIKVIELNGSNSEPAHIYDPSYSILKAYRDLFKHWNIMYRIAKINHELNGVQYESARNTIRILRTAEKNRDELR